MGRGARRCERGRIPACAGMTESSGRWARPVEIPATSAGMREVGVADFPNSGRRERLECGKRACGGRRSS